MDKHTPLTEEQNKAAATEEKPSPYLGADAAPFLTGDSKKTTPTATETKTQLENQYGTPDGWDLGI